MEITIINTTRKKPRIKAHFQLIARIVDKKLGELKGTVNLIFCDDKTIRKLNKQHRKKDQVTDVLSFPYLEDNTNSKDLLGEIYLDLDQAEKQALEHGISLTKEVYNLFIHSLLHLRGYNHKKEKDFRVMKLLEEQILESLKNSINP